MARPREFDPDQALDRVQRVFWSGGYHGTSMQDLETATGLKKQSLYREFGNKDAMYARSLALYQKREVAKLAEVVSEAGSAAERFRDLFEAVLKPVRGGDRSGCFLCNSAVEHAHDDDQIMMNTKSGIQDTQELFANALGVSEPYKGDENLRRQMALILTAGYFGLRVMIRGGTPLAVLEETTDMLLENI